VEGLKELQQHFEINSHRSPGDDRWQSGVAVIRLLSDLNEKDKPVSLQDISSMTKAMAEYTYSTSLWNDLAVIVLNWLKSQPPNLQATAMVMLFEDFSCQDARSVARREKWRQGHTIAKEWQRLINQRSTSQTEVEDVLEASSNCMHLSQELLFLADMIEKWAQSNYSIGIGCETLESAP
jgi:hypothetical protein